MYHVIIDVIFEMEEIKENNNRGTNYLTEAYG